MSSLAQQKIRTISKILSPLCVLVFILIPALVAAVWFWGDESFIRSGEPSHYFVPYGIELQSDLNPGTRIAGFVISLLPNLLLLYGIWHLRALFLCFGQLEFFSQRTTRHMRAFALANFVYAFAYPLAGGLLSVALSSLDPATPTLLILTAGHHELMALFIGGVFLLIASLMAEGQRLSDEVEHFV